MPSIKVQDATKNVYNKTLEILYNTLYCTYKQHKNMENYVMPPPPSPTCFPSYP